MNFTLLPQVVGSLARGLGCVLGRSARWAPASQAAFGLAIAAHTGYLLLVAAPDCGGLPPRLVELVLAYVVSAAVSLCDAAKDTPHGKAL